jgi:general stress protein YciG
MTVKVLKGFAAMAPEVRRAIQSKGGRTPRPNRGFASDPEWAAICGAKGGRNGWGKTPSDAVGIAPRSREPR